MNDRAIKKIKALTSPWQVSDPFLFCMHHRDDYPQANEGMGPKASLSGRNLGADFVNLDGWNMYHGETVPGFPQHPHRGFETVTFAREGLIDHADSLGASARFGRGDAQWITAGKGLSHSEMFPLIHTQEKNPTELFQIWLNLARADKGADPYFSIFWAESIPKVEFQDEAGNGTEVTLVAGVWDETRAPSPPPRSWAARPENEVAIWTIKLAPGARWHLPKTSRGLNRTLYFFRGAALTADRVSVSVGHSLELSSDFEVLLENGREESELLLLQGRPIGEPVAQHGPFVMNTADELRQAFQDYRETTFGGWPWPSDDPVFPREEPRFAKYPDGTYEQKIGNGLVGMPPLRRVPEKKPRDSR